MKLELGAGDRPTPGYIHNDERPLDDIEIVCKAEHIGWLHDEKSYEVIRATHLLEHFSWRDTVDLLKSWMRLLKPGGQLYLEVPNLTWQAKAILGQAAGPNGEAYTMDEMVEFVYGSQDYSGNYHKTAFTTYLLRDKLLKAGYDEVWVEANQQIISGGGIRPYDEVS